MDEALLASVRGGAAPTLRIYRWDPPCLSLGRNQPARGRYDTGRIAAAGWEVVRRPTGGRAVLHAKELTYSALLPEGLLGGPRATYAALNRALVAGLRRLDVAAALQPRSGRRAAAPSLAPCFGEAAEGEVVAEGSKLVGSAQRRERGVLLQHGSLPLEGDPSAVAALLRDATGSRESETLPVSLASFCTPLPAWPELVRTLLQGWSEDLAVTLCPGALTAAEELDAAEAAERFRDPAWSWRR
ncbi:MAG: octanoyltransferase [Gemmatimonadota bacterium]|nr:octanoyltransferase [Gemmatimonadota bacterium]